MPKAGVELSTQKFCSISCVPSPHFTDSKLRLKESASANVLQAIKLESWYGHLALAKGAVGVGEVAQKEDSSPGVGGWEADAAVR